MRRTAESRAGCLGCGLRRNSQCFPLCQPDLGNVDQSES